MTAIWKDINDNLEVYYLDKRRTKDTLLGREEIALKEVVYADDTILLGNQRKAVEKQLEELEKEAENTDYS